MEHLASSKQEAVMFTDFNGVVLERNGRLSKLASCDNERWDGCACTQMGIEGPSSRIRGVSFVVAAAKIFMVGWSSDEEQRGNPSAETIDYAAYIYEDGRFLVYESGANVREDGAALGAVQPNDVVTVVLNDQNKFDFGVNGQVRYTSQRQVWQPSFPLYLKLSPFQLGPCAQHFQWILRETRTASSGVENQALQSMAEDKLQLEVRLAKLEAENRALRKQLSLTSKSDGEPEREPSKPDDGRQTP
mmetsp:Transcript_41686/g.75706  ORF Transcript_41686/g.75706 Transcript_41686/m.75706 type:complete len:246 (+) Transcript_41686:83-820(+)